MKRSQLQLSQKKHKLNEMKRKGQKNPIWSLTFEELDYIHSIGFKTRPFLYQIRTRTFQSAKKLPAILKEIHYAKINGKKWINKPLKMQELKMLEDFNVQIKVLKYEIVLR